MTPDVPEDDLDERPSKSSLKREMLALQALGKKLAELTPETLRKMPLDERLLDTILQLQKMTQREAHRRHLQLVGKLMREADIEAVKLAYENTQTGSIEASRARRPPRPWSAPPAAPGRRTAARPARSGARCAPWTTTTAT